MQTTQTKPIVRDIGWWLLSRLKRIISSTMRGALARLKRLATKSIVRLNMDVPALQNLGNLPYATLTAGMLFQLLGPTAKYLGTRTQEWTQASLENCERVLKQACQRIPNDAPKDGKVPPRVLRASMVEAAYTEDETAAAYLGGVLASSKNERGDDDRGVCINAMISRLSTYQLRLHYIAYTALHELLQGTDPVPKGSDQRERLHYGTNGLLFAMGLFNRDRDNDIDEIDAAITHALYGLSREELIASWEFSWASGFKCVPTPVGIELFLWANGHGRRPIEFFYSRHFTPVDIPTEQVPIYAGRSISVVDDDGEQAEFNGFDYAVHSNGLHYCKVPPKDEVENEPTRN